MKRPKGYNWPPPPERIASPAKVENLLPQEAFCLGCGCSDSHACTHSVTGPCWWLKVDYKKRIGVCSECEHKLDEFYNRMETK